MDCLYSPSGKLPQKRLRLPSFERPEVCATLELCHEGFYVGEGKTCRLPGNPLAQNQGLGISKPHPLVEHVSFSTSKPRVCLIIVLSRNVPLHAMQTVF